MTSSTSSTERTDILEALAKHRELLPVHRPGPDRRSGLHPDHGQRADARGLVKHVSSTEREWARFVVEGDSGGPALDWENIDWSNPPPEVVAYQNAFRMG